MAAFEMSKLLVNKARSHYADCRQRGFRPEDTLLLTANPEAGGNCRGIPSSGVSTILANLFHPGTPRPQTSVAEAQAVFSAQDSADRLPEFSTHSADSENTLPGKVPLLDHLAAYLKDKPDWFYELEVPLRDLQSCRLPVNTDRLELTLGESSDDEWEVAHRLLLANIKDDLNGWIWLQAADTEGYQAALDWGKSTNGFQEAMTRIASAKLEKKESITFNPGKRGKPGVSIPVRFFVGGATWQIHVRLPTTSTTDKGPPNLKISLTTTVSDAARAFFAALPPLVGFGICEDYLQWAKVVWAIWGDTFFQTVAAPIEIRDLMILAGINMAQSSMFISNWWTMGSILPKDKASCGDNLWAKPLADIPLPLRRYLALDTAQPVSVAWTLILIWTVTRFPDFTWVAEVADLTPYSLLEWVSNNVFKRLVRGWRRFKVTSPNPCYVGVDVIPVHQPESVRTYSELLKHAGIPAGQQYDILRLDPKWPALTSGGPRFIHTVRHFSNSVLPVLHALDSTVWPILQKNRAECLRFGVPVENCVEYPVNGPVDARTEWLANPGVLVLDLPVGNLKTITRMTFGPKDNRARGLRTMFLELARIAPYLTKDLVLHFEADPIHLQELVGTDRKKRVIVELRTALAQLHMEIPREEGWVDPFAADQWIRETKKRMATTLHTQLEQARARTASSQLLEQRVEAAIAEAEDPTSLNIGSSSKLKRWREPLKQNVNIQSASSFIVATGEPPRPKRQRVLPPVTLQNVDEELELFLSDRDRDLEMF